MDDLNYRRPGRSSRKVLSRGIVQCSLEYDNDGHEVAKFYTSPRVIRKAGIFAISMTALHKYAEDRHLMKAAKFAAGLIGIGGGRDDIKLMADFMNDAIIELLIMKPMPAEFAEDIGTIEDVKMGENSGRIVVSGRASRTLQ